MIWYVFKRWNMWDTWSTMDAVMYAVIFWPIMCTKLGLYSASDVDTSFGSAVGGGFEVGVEDWFGSENGIIVSNDSKDEVHLRLVKVKVEVELEEKIENKLSYKFKSLV